MHTSHKTNTAIAQRLKEARIQRAYRSGRQFALRHGIATNTYLNHEGGKRGMSLRVLQRYARLLPCSYLWLVTGVGRWDLTSEELVGPPVSSALRAGKSTQNQAATGSTHDKKAHTSERTRRDWRGEPMTS